MALNPKFAAQRLLPGGSARAVHTLELFLDYVCPFSKKMFTTVYKDIIPMIEKKYPGKVALIFRQQIQPWHPSSTLTHEAGAAVLRLNPDKFFDFSFKLFEKQTEYFDVNVVHEARNQTYKRLAALAAEAGVVDDESKVFDLLRISDKPGPDGSLNSGNGVTDDIKQMVKLNRALSVHVTPTVLFNGIVENTIASSWKKEEWAEWLERNIK